MAKNSISRREKTIWTIMTIAIVAILLVSIYIMFELSARSLNGWYRSTTSGEQTEYLHISGDTCEMVVAGSGNESVVQNTYTVKLGDSIGSYDVSCDLVSDTGETELWAFHNSKSHSIYLTKPGNNEALATYAKCRAPKI